MFSYIHNVLPCQNPFTKELFNDFSSASRNIINGTNSYPFAVSLFAGLGICFSLTKAFESSRPIRHNSNFEKTTKKCQLLTSHFFSYLKTGLHLTVGMTAYLTLVKNIDSTGWNGPLLASLFFLPVLMLAKTKDDNEVRTLQERKVKEFAGEGVTEYSSLDTIDSSRARTISPFDPTLNSSGDELGPENKNPFGSNFCQPPSAIFAKQLPSETNSKDNPAEKFSFSPSCGSPVLIAPPVSAADSEEETPYYAPIDKPIDEPIDEPRIAATLVKQDKLSEDALNAESSDPDDLRSRICMSLPWGLEYINELSPGPGPAPIIFSDKDNASSESEASIASIQNQAAATADVNAESNQQNQEPGFELFSDV